MNDSDRLDQANRLAFVLYEMTLAVGDPSSDDLERRLMSVLLAAVWVASGRRTSTPWKNVDVHPPMKKDQFIEWASEMWDAWELQRPRPLLRLV